MLIFNQRHHAKGIIRCRFLGHVPAIHVIVIHIQGGAGESPKLLSSKLFGKRVLCLFSDTDTAAETLRITMMLGCFSVA